MADSTQVYRGMDIGTDKPGPADRGGVPHQLIDRRSKRAFNAGQFRRAALCEIGRLHGEGRVPLVVGGTVYVRTLAYGLWEGPPANWDLRRGWLAEEATHGEGYLWSRLAEGFDRNWRQPSPAPPSQNCAGFGGRGGNRHAAFAYGISVMVFESARFLRIMIDSPWSGGRSIDALTGGCCVRLRTVLLRRPGTCWTRDTAKSWIHEGPGYRQISGYLKGLYDYNEAVRRLQRDTRRFAKRQMTWFRRRSERALVHARRG